LGKRVQLKRGAAVVAADLTTSHPAKVRATLYVPAVLLEEARDATVFLAGYPVRLTLSRLVEEALGAELRRLKDQHNAGRDFPQRSESLKGGRPIAA
jgi:post-segregation antitoxin (ccd killing protein)